MPYPNTFIRFALSEIIIEIFTNRPYFDFVEFRKEGATRIDFLAKIASGARYTYYCLATG
jgi:hypothetical protein